MSLDLWLLGSGSGAGAGARRPSSHMKIGLVVTWEVLSTYYEQAC